MPENGVFAFPASLRRHMPVCSEPRLSADPIRAGMSCASPPSGAAPDGGGSRGVRRLGRGTVHAVWPELRRGGQQAGGSGELPVIRDLGGEERIAERLHRACPGEGLPPLRGARLRHAPTA